MDPVRFPQLIASIYETVQELEEMFKGRRFTPDGHMVGSLGEALASHYYGVVLSPASAKCHDGTCAGKSVQVKATQRDSVALSSCPNHLLVLKIDKRGSFDEIYNGPGDIVWATVAGKPLPKNGQHQVRLTRLRRLMASVDAADRLPRLHQ